MKVKARLLNHGGYDGLKHLAFPIDVEGYFFKSMRYIDVPMSELERIGYDKVAGCVAEIPDQNNMSEPLPFMVTWGEAEVLEVLE